MKKLLILGVVLSALSACSSTQHGGNTQVYGQIKGGVEHTHMQ